MNLFLKISGVILLLLGFMLTIRPAFFADIPKDLDAYQMIEKRVKWGIVIGLGGFLIFYSNWNSWGLIITVLLASLTIGIIIARLIGFILDGFFIKQLYWLLIELAALIVFGILYWKQTR